jgi:DNA-binding transcriptional MerR regulator
LHLSTLDGKKKVYTADDLEYQEVIKDWANEEDIPLEDIFEEESSIGLFKKKRQPTQAEIEFREKQAKIQEELDSRTGRLWEERWTITDEEWMSTDTWEDIEDWSIKMATRKALESVKVWDGEYFVAWLL